MTTKFISTNAGGDVSTSEFFSEPSIRDTVTVAEIFKAAEIDF